MKDIIERITRIEKGEHISRVYDKPRTELGERMAMTERECDYRQLALKYLESLVTPPMNWKPVSELPPIDADGYSEMLWVWISQDIQLRAKYQSNDFSKFRTACWRVDDATRSFVYPTHWCEVTPPSNATPEGLSHSILAGLREVLKHFGAVAISAKKDHFEIEYDGVSWRGPSLSAAIASAITANDIGEIVPPPIPSKVYWSGDNFYSLNCEGMGNEFYREWKDRCDEFPSEPDPSSALAEALERLIVCNDQYQRREMDYRHVGVAWEQARATLAIHRKAGE